ncbi:Ank_2 domain-containing protein/zf-C3HC4_3 domain-containing protein [Cephalotus follicularis]|uniref:Ank_2 domain-containing protein/zf-C3HC4_3 domain-containing protein n=1 Tax=Cephalotus follicularis TaxID=3775 RepID=A0A1Q3CZ29_CEPFO|nr:Ank_2 domain-containing protein/zf-C3HC4_3 domain-containing protein [Cephalotus follicularis]
MGQQQSKDELLYQQVNYGNTEGIKALSSDGAGLEWIDRDGKTPLILACMNPELFNVAKTLIQLGANVNAYRPGRHAGTPLHHAAKRGLESTVKLLLSHGANALMMNDDCQTPLDIARAKGFANVVRAIEGHVCLFSGWLREFYGPGFLEVLAPQLVSRKIWVVVLPCGSRNLKKPFKLDLAIYSSMQDAQPRMVIALWKANLEEPKFNQTDPSVIIVDNATMSRGRRRRRSVYISREVRCRHLTPRQTRIKFAPANEGDKQQLQWFCDACKGIPQGTHPAFLHNSSQTPVIEATAPPAAEDMELAMAISASMQSAITQTPIYDVHSNTEAYASSSFNHHVNSSHNHNSMGATMAFAPLKLSGNKWATNETGASGSSTQYNQTQDDVIPADQTTVTPPDSIPTAPPIADEILEAGPIQYPSIDFSPVDVSSTPIENLLDRTGEMKEDGGASSSCVICLDAPVEGACVPCGHMAGCMSCLEEIKAKKWGCPVCRTKIIQVIKLYAV